MNSEKIKRINELAKKSRTEGLTDDEKKEQQVLRREYLTQVRKNIKAQLDSIQYIED